MPARLPVVGTTNVLVEQVRARPQGVGHRRLDAARGPGTGVPLSGLEVPDWTENEPSLPTWSAAVQPLSPSSNPPLVTSWAARAGRADGRRQGQGQDEGRGGRPRPEQV